MVTVPLILGAGLGAGVWLCVRALRPRPQPIAAVLAQLERPGQPLDASGPAQRQGITHRAEALARRMLATVGLPTRLTPAFELVGRSPERHALNRVAATLAGLLVPSFLAVGLAAAGMRLPVGLVAVLTVGAGLAGWILPELSLRDRAEQRRRAFRHALSAYLDLVNILLAGGAGIETALYAAAHVGDGWGFEKIRHALDRARLTGQSPWETFAELGARLDISELSELAASVSLAGSHGARIRASLAAKADAVRGHQVAETESAAESATERMTIPVAVMLAGFLVFIAYPALLEVTSVS
jgi:tight adherence protein C